MKNYYDPERLKEYCSYYEPFRRKRFAEIFRMPSLKNFPGNSVLDIGCGFGWFLEELQQRGWKRLVGIDYSRLSRRDTGKGLEIINKEFSPKLELEARFDLIILSNVLEHLWYPLDCLRWIKDHLRRESGGRLLLVVPTADGMLMRLSHRFIRAFPRLSDRMVEDIYQTDSTMGHRVLYTTAGVIKLCRMAGLTVLDREATPIIDTTNIRIRMLIEKDRLTGSDHLKAFLLRQLARLATRRGKDDELALVLTPA
ncbi:MAG: class I SAM-dependent methyltransferase [Candidatus Erginobacter occultus]|nr:class I SAM-dependent methyltransferase [Candidatus Erginobacter occultus]